MVAHGKRAMHLWALPVQTRSHLAAVRWRLDGGARIKPSPVTSSTGQLCAGLNCGGIVARSIIKVRDAIPLLGRVWQHLVGLGRLDSCAIYKIDRFRGCSTALIPRSLSARTFAGTR